MTKFITVDQLDSQKPVTVGIDHIALITADPEGRAVFVMSNGLHVFSTAPAEYVRKVLQEDREIGSLSLTT